MRAKGIALFTLIVYVVSVVVSVGIISDGKRIKISEENLGMMCVAIAYPALSRGEEREKKELIVSEDREASGEDADSGMESRSIVPAAEDERTVIIEGANKETDEPLVIIYHTHATEAYRPISEGNFRTLEEAGSVREVGSVLTEELKKLGITAIHDKTLHDAESYNQSYSKSLETIQALMNKYPSAVFVIDLHRDAAAYTGGKGKIVTVSGETAASYALVVGQGNPNADSLNAFANKVNTKAEELYPGFGGRIISKSYKYNQHVSDSHILLEVGNNENNIREAKITAKYFAHVMAEVIGDMTGDT